MELSEWKDLALILVSVVNIVIATWGFNRWRDEHKNKRRLELVEDALVSLRMVEREFKNSRSPFIAAHEYPSDFLKKHTHPNAVSLAVKIDAECQVYTERYRRLHKELSRLDAATVPIEVVYFQGIEKHINSLFNLFNDVVFSCEQYYGIKASGEYDADAENICRYRDDMRYVIGKCDDKMSVKIDQAVKQMKHQLRKISIK